MGTTRDAFNAGSLSFVWVVAIEGYPALITNGDTAAAVTAWAGTEFTTAIGGLGVEISVEQALNPDAPLPRMGTCTLWVVPTPGDDSFGVAVGRATSTFETYLAATADNDDTTITVKSTSGATGGFIHIGTECIAYTGTTPTTFTGCTRGKFSPFGSFNDVFTGYASGRHFGHYHRVGPDPNTVNLQPRVTTSPRQWIGRWVGVWAHRVVNGVLDTRAQAELVFAGKIHETRDDVNTFATVVSLIGATEVLAEAAIGASQWQGVGKEGIYLAAGATFGFQDTKINGGVVPPTVTTKTANVLTVVTSSAAGANQINAGYYTLAQISSAITTWFASERAAGRLQGTYTMTSPFMIGADTRTRIVWTLANAANNSAGWLFDMPPAIAPFFGYTTTQPSPLTTGNVAVGVASASGGAGLAFDSDSAPQTVAIATDGGDSARANISSSSGTLVDQYNALPAELRPGSAQINGVTYSWGLFLINDERLVRAAFATSSPTELLKIQAVLTGDLTFSMLGNPLFGYAPIASSVFNVRQIYAFEQDPITLIVSLAIGTGTPAYNTPYVDFPFGCGASLPYELVQNLPLSMAGIPSLGGSMVVIIEKPTRLAELLNPGLGFRWAFLHWHNGGIEAGAWKAPTGSLANVTLDETNKAEPMGHAASHRTATIVTTEWVRQIVKIRYNRNAANPKGDDYSTSIQFEDRAAVDDAGGAPTTVTLSLRDTYSEFHATGQSAESLLPNYLALMPLISRPARKVTRSIDPTLFLQLGLGEVVLLTDTFARDPETGLRGLLQRPSLVSKIRYNFGGWVPGSDKPTPPGGEVDLLFTDTNPDRTGANYVPSADLNDLYSIGSFDHGYDGTNFKLHCLTNRYTETSEGSDASFFRDGDKVLIIERDPLDPDNPIQWLRTIATNGVAGDELALTAGLSTPAWDSTTKFRKYHIIAQDFGTATATQKLNVYQADDANGLITSTTQPFLYGAGSADQTYTTNAAMESRYSFSTPTAIELPPNARLVDGAARDVAHEAALIRLVDNGIDYTSAMQLPMLGAIASNTSYSSGGGYLLTHYFRLFLSFEILSTNILRRITVAPWAYSTDGTSTKLRVTLARNRPSFGTTTDVVWSGTISQYEWTGITSTTPGVLSDGYVFVNVKDASGLAWCAIELGFKCATRGLAKFLEGPRQTS